MPDWVRHFMDAARADGTRSSSLTPLQWLVAICFSGTVALTHASGSVWIAVLGFVVIIGLSVFYCNVYWYQMKQSPDALRSERYPLSKMAIEKGLVGDDLTDLTARKVVIKEQAKDDEQLPAITGPGVGEPADESTEGGS
jgi:hypothetical protein